MIPRWLFPGLLWILLAPGLLHADPEPSGAPVSSRADRKMYEDIEIMRHILDRKLRALYPGIVHADDVWLELNGRAANSPYYWVDLGFPTNLNHWGNVYPNQPNFHQPYTNPWMQGLYTYNRPYRGQDACKAFEVEGVYLKGQGVVYTATVASLQTSSQIEANRPPLSEWESVRRELRNEKEAPRKPAAEKPTLLQDILLKVLAENGRHFSQLGADESVRLVITVRPREQSSSAPKAPGGSTKTEAKAASEGKGDSSVAAKVRDLELLGDLHMKREHYGMARDAYREAMQLKPDRQQMAVLARKLAQAYLLLSNLEEARSALDQSLALTKENASTSDKAVTDKPTAVALPTKVIISAPKRLLDQVGEGKISFDEFRRQASAETLTFDAKGH